MQKIIFSSITLAVLSTSIFAGGKAVAPAYAVVTPIPVIETPIPLYIGIGALATSITRDPCSCTPNAGRFGDHRYGIVARIGADYNQYIGIEGRYLKTLGSNSFSDIEHYGLYLKPQYHMTYQTNVYGLIGYGRTTVDYTNGVRSSHNPENGFSYGLGFEYDFNAENQQATYNRLFDGQGNQEKGWGLWIDAQHLLSNAGFMHTDANVVTAGITYDF